MYRISSSRPVSLIIVPSVPSSPSTSIPHQPQASKHATAPAGDIETTAQHTMLPPFLQVLHPKTREKKPRESTAERPVQPQHDSAKTSPHDAHASPHQPRKGGSSRKAKRRRSREGARQGHCPPAASCVVMQCRPFQVLPGRGESSAALPLRDRVLSLVWGSIAVVMRILQLYLYIHARYLAALT